MKRNRLLFNDLPEEERIVEHKEVRDTLRPAYVRRSDDAWWGHTIYKIPMRLLTFDEETGQVYQIRKASPGMFHSDTEAKKHNMNYFKLSPFNQVVKNRKDRKNQERIDAIASHLPYDELLRYIKSFL